MALGMLVSGGLQQGVASISVAGSVDVNLTTAQAQNGTIKLTGAIGADINLIVPMRTGQFIFFENRSTGAHNITIKNTSGTGIVVAGNGGNKGAVLYFDGTNVLRVTPDTVVTA